MENFTGKIEACGVKFSVSLSSRTWYVLVSLEILSSRLDFEQWDGKWKLIPLSAPLFIQAFIPYANTYQEESVCWAQAWGSEMRRAPVCLQAFLVCVTDRGLFSS